ncbi:type II toxin-antitoxin system RelE/ParE family toxin [Crocosphaera sp. Alani8]|uniref:type II toxin-antitoxin system RelE/ParE family toxin n=1 Tax=Crocosphaera sp. Alani8 TaxID=3038952 RepID=UPI00313CC52B
MDYQVIFSPKAVNDLEKIVRYIAINNPEAAKRIGQQLLSKAKELSKFPLRGQIVPELNDHNLRQLILKPYRIIYRVEQSNKQISIARFWHSSRESLEL